MRRKDTIFGAEYQKLILVGCKILDYEEMFVETPIYIRYVVLTIVIFTSMFTIEIFYLTQKISFITCFFECLHLFLSLQICDISLTRFKELRTFCPCSSVDPLVKGTNNFWKIRGLIDRFNESRRQIGSGVEKTIDESMSAIQFRTTPKGDL